MLEYLDPIDTPFSSENSFGNSTEKFSIPENQDQANIDSRGKLKFDYTTQIRSNTKAMARPRIHNLQSEANDKKKETHPVIGTAIKLAEHKIGDEAKRSLREIVEEAIRTAKEGDVVTKSTKLPEVDVVRVAKEVGHKLLVHDLEGLALKAWLDRVREEENVYGNGRGYNKNIGRNETKEPPTDINIQIPNGSKNQQTINLANTSFFSHSPRLQTNLTGNNALRLNALSDATARFGFERGSYLVANLETDALAELHEANYRFLRTMHADSFDSASPLAVSKALNSELMAQKRIRLMQSEAPTMAMAA